MDKCPVCGSSEFIYDEHKGTVYCAKCGYVMIDHEIDKGPEWRGVDKNGRSLSRASPVSASSPGFNLYVDVISINKPKFRIIPSLSLFSPSERNIMMLRSIAKQIIANVGLPESILDEVVLNYRLLTKMGYRGRIKETAVALIYIACRKRNLPCTMKDLLKNSDVDVKGFNKAYMHIANLMNIKGIYNDEQLINMTLKIVNVINVNSNIKHRLMLLIRDMINKGKAVSLFNGKTFTSTIAAMVYLSLLIYNIKIRQREIASIAGVTDVTIRNRYNELLKRLNFRVTI
ncbi:MAG: TFIIB-type zinc ribbon-containing protein [Caldivirga sp.]|uniref:TFIIB-type zinc ribbon-containing protein n=1 Tax=Caldivirga sp. TaxID=2080243 RepID=UPI003D134E57